ncbi:MAG: GDP-mannose 4,6-dehydratase [Pseudomonadota bacterium]|nr:GDP-mannose 4,6-dehydratase [Pseudomonadota bacterium]
MTFRNCYKNRRVLVTGHTGFKGSWLAIWLKELGAEVIGYALAPPSEPSIFAATGLADKIVHEHGDVRDLDRLSDVFTRFRPEMVFHLAAQALVRSSYDDPKTTFDTNIGGTVNVLEMVRRTDSVRVLVNVTSDKCYENQEWVWGYRENDPMGGHDPYSASKGCAELVFAAYLRSFFSYPIGARFAEGPVTADSAGRNSTSSAATGGVRQIGAASCRAGNAIGGGDWGQDRLLPDCVRAWTGGTAVAIRNPRAIRPWQHVLELLSGYLWLGTRLWEEPEKYSGGWNFGPPNEAHVNVGEVVNRFLQVWGSGQWQDVSGPGTFHEAATLRLCCDKAGSCLGWRNALSLEQAIDLTATWYRMFYVNDGANNIYELCVEQIRNYTDIAGRSNISWTM